MQIMRVFQSCSSGRLLHQWFSVTRIMKTKKKGQFGIRQQVSNTLSFIALYKYKLKSEKYGLVSECIFIFDGRTGFGKGQLCVLCFLHKKNSW